MLACILKWVLVPIQAREENMTKKLPTNAIKNEHTKERGRPSKIRRPRQADAELKKRNITDEPAPLPPGSPAPADLLPPLISFFRAQNMCVQIVDPNSAQRYGTAGKLPDIIAAALPADLMSFAARASLLDSVWPLPVRTIGCVAVPMITSENLHAVLIESGTSARFWAHEGYIAAAHISADCDFRKELAELSTFFKIGVIQIGNGATSNTRIIHLAQGLEIDTSLGITCPRLSE
jgi:hypothetical protein